MIHPGRHTSLSELLDDAFATFPSDLALVEADRDRERTRMTFRQARDAARNVAAWLTSRGLTHGARVGIIAANQPGWLLAATAILHVGGVIVPLDPRLTASEQSALLRHAGARALVVDHHVLRALDLDLTEVLVLGAPDGPLPEGATRFEEALACGGPAPRVARVRADDACIVYSSGTGGDPKGCRLSHGAYLAQYQALMETFAWHRGDRYLSILPTNHAIDFMCGFVASWATGTTVIHQRTLRPDTIVATMRRYRVTQLSVVPLVLQAFRRAIEARLDEAGERRRLLDGLVGLNRALTERAPRQGLSRWLLKPVHDAFGGHLRTIFCGGAYTPPELVRFFLDLGLPVAVGYGLTEACTVATLNDLHPPRPDTVGTAVPGVRVRVAEPDGEGVGEVQLHGPTLFSGYLDDPELTAAAFTDDGWLRTGDLGWLDGAHHLHLVGRARNLVVTPGGKNVYPEDVEGLLESPLAEELCVLAEDFVWPRRGGLGDERLVAVLRADDRQAAAHALSARNRRLPDFKRVAGVVWWDEPFPRTPTLKIKRGALADAVRERLDRDCVQELP